MGISRRCISGGHGGRLAACRAVICGALWPDRQIRTARRRFGIRQQGGSWTSHAAADGDMKLLATSSEEGKARWAALTKSGISPSPTNEAELLTLRGAMLDFIADFANWDNSTVPDYLETSRR